MLEEQGTRSVAPLTPEEARALELAAELRARIQRERETAQLLGDYLVATAAAADTALASDPEATPG